MDKAKELGGQRATLTLGLMLLVEEGAEGLDALVEGFKGGVSLEEFQEALALDGSKSRGPHSKDGQGAAMVLNLWGDLAAKGHEVIKDDADDMEAVCDDASLWKPFFDEVAVGATEVDADHPHTLSAL